MEAYFCDTHTHIQTQSLIHTHTNRTYILIYILTHAHTSIHTHSQTQDSLLAHTLTHTHTHTVMHTHKKDFKILILKFKDNFYIII